MRQYKFNQYDVKTHFGITFLRGVDSQLLLFGAKKDNGLDIDWINQHGTERYHSESFFKTKRYEIDMMMQAKDETEFWQRYHSLEDFFRTSGEFNFDLVHRNRRFKVSYSEMTTVENLTDLGTGAVAVIFTIILLDDHPAERFTI